jgi:hypothetical protein
LVIRVWHFQFAQQTQQQFYLETASNSFCSFFGSVRMLDGILWIRCIRHRHRSVYHRPTGLNMSPLVFVLLFFTVTGKLKHIFFLFVELFVASGREIFFVYPVLIIGHGRPKVVAGLDEIFNPLVPPGRDVVVVLVYKGTRYFWGRRSCPIGSNRS